MCDFMFAVHMFMGLLMMMLALMMRMSRVQTRTHHPPALRKRVKMLLTKQRPTQVLMRTKPPL